MRTETTGIYQYDELPTEEAKKQAREWYSRGVFTDSYEWEFVYDDAVQVGGILGIKIEETPVRTVGGTEQMYPSIFFSGFYSQGDGACFEGGYSYAPDACQKIREFAPKDETLHAIADGLEAVQKEQGRTLAAKCYHRGHYNHSGCMLCDVIDSENPFRDIGDAEVRVTHLLREFADWIYGRLKDEYEYQSSDEQVEESIRANEYEFTADGKRYP